MASKLFYLMSFLSVLTFSCQKKYSPLEYKAWIESEQSGLNKEKVIGPYIYRVQYQTPEYLVLLEKGPSGMADCNLTEELLNHSDACHFAFSILCETGEDPIKYRLESQEQFYARQEYLLTGVANDFFLTTTDRDTLKCLHAHAEKGLGISPELIIDLAFDSPKNQEKLQFCYQDRMFNNGMIKFSFSEENMSNLPQLRQK